MFILLPSHPNFSIFFIITIIITTTFRFNFLQFLYPILLSFNFKSATTTQLIPR